MHSVPHLSPPGHNSYRSEVVDSDEVHNGSDDKSASADEQTPCDQPPSRRSVRPKKEPARLITEI